MPQESLGSSKVSVGRVSGVGWARQGLWTSAQFRQTRETAKGVRSAGSPQYATCKQDDGLWLPDPWVLMTGSVLNNSLEALGKVKTSVTTYIFQR